jgi:hypothetical protein
MSRIMMLRTIFFVPKSSATKQWYTEGGGLGGSNPSPKKNTKLQLSPEPLTRGPLPPDPRSLCPQLNLLNPPPNKIPGYATATKHSDVKVPCQ